MKRPLIRFHPHPTRDHTIKLIITGGTFISVGISMFFPHYTNHASVVAVATNVLWIWA